MLRDALSRYWWVLGVRGLVAVLFGLMALAWPGLTLVVLVALFGAYALVDGGFAVAGGIRGRSWPFVLEGVLGVIAGAMAFLWPGVTAVALLAIIAAWAVITGIIEIVAAAHMRRMVAHWWLMMIGGVLSIACGVVLAARPAAGALALVWAIGAYALLFGVALVALALRLRSLGHEAIEKLDERKAA